MAGDEKTRRETYDWALDLEPLALPPDLPPVMVIVCDGGRTGKLLRSGS
jgi:hypothetical protein